MQCRSFILSTIQMPPYTGRQWTKLNSKEYPPYEYHGDTRRELLIRSRYLLPKSATSGLRSRNKEQKSYLKNTLT